MGCPPEVLDHFKTLDLRPNAQRSLDDVKKRFRQLAKLHHPDKSDAANAKELFQKICNAYEQLIIYFDNEDEKNRKKKKKNSFQKVLSDLILQSRRSVHDENIVIKGLPSKFLDQFRSICDGMYGSPEVLKDKSYKYSTNFYSLKDEDNKFGIIHLTVYNNGTMMCQGNSNLLWHAEHLPSILGRLVGSGSAPSLTATSNTSRVLAAEAEDDDAVFVDADDSMMTDPAGREVVGLSGLRDDSEKEVLEIRDEMKELRGQIGGLDSKLELVLGAVEQAVKEIEAMRGTVRKILKSTENHEVRLKSIEEKLNSQTSEVKQLKETVGKFDDRVGELEKSMAEVKTSVSGGENIEMKIRDLEKSREELLWRAIDSEARSRRDNLLFFGVKEVEREDVSRVVSDIIRKDLGLDGDFPLQRAHRLGAPRRNHIGQHAKRPRPIIVNFLDHRDKETVRSAKFKLKAPLSIQEDFPEEIRRARASLVPEQKELRNQGKKTTIAYPARLIADGKIVREAKILNFTR